MESLGFSEGSLIWSDSPLPVAVPESSRPSGRHLAPPEADPMAGWSPEEFGTRLGGSNLRWGVITAFLVFLAAAGAVGFWLYQRPATQERASQASLDTAAADLDQALPLLAEFNAAFADSPDTVDAGTLQRVDTAARALFAASGELADSDTANRQAAASASQASLDGVRLASEAFAYQQAIRPMLVTPQLETDPSRIELDQAARDFGAWQLGFEQVRNALPDGALPEVTEQLDIVRGDLGGVLNDYVDALADDDPTAAADVLEALGRRLDGVDATLNRVLAGVQQRVTARVAETQTALDDLLPG
jgi:hypothetical protein